MADFGTNSHPSSSSKPPTSSFLFGFAAFTEPVMSPTSILDTKPFSALKNPFRSESHTTKSTQTDSKFDVGGVGLGIIDSLTNDSEKKKLIIAKKSENSKLVLFGSQLKVQIPTPNNPFALDSPNSPMEFGIKTKSSQLGIVDTPGSSPLIFNGSLSSAEMELSEDYTCIIAREGPVIKTTRIFDNCVLESFCLGDSVVSSLTKDEDGFSGSGDEEIGYPSENFLSFCCTCGKNLSHGQDIYMYSVTKDSLVFGFIGHSLLVSGTSYPPQNLLIIYYERGEKAFCSVECRQEEMVMEDHDT